MLAFLFVFVRYMHTGITGDRKHTSKVGQGAGGHDHTRKRGVKHHSQPANRYRAERVGDGKVWMLLEKKQVGYGIPLPVCFGGCAFQIACILRAGGGWMFVGRRESGMTKAGRSRGCKTVVCFRGFEIQDF